MSKSQLVDSNFSKNEFLETKHKTIVGILNSRIRTCPDKVILTYLKNGDTEEEVWTYSILFERSKDIARELQKKAEIKDRALIVLPQCLDYIAAIFGCFLSGIIAVPAYPPKRNREDSRILSILENSGAKVIIGSEKVHASCSGHNSELLSKDWISPSTNSKSNKGFTTHQILEEDIALLQYTSGSTGDPKGVVITHKNIISNVNMLNSWLNTTEEDCAVSWLPIFHDMGIIDGVFHPIFSNFPLVLMAPVDFIQKPHRWLRAMSEYNGTRSGAPNFAFHHCCDRIDDDYIDGLELSHVKSIYNAAEPVRMETIDQFVQKFRKAGISEKKIITGYGLAEATLVLSGSRVNQKPNCLTIEKSTHMQKKIKIADRDKDSVTLVSIGPPSDSIDLRIVDPKTCRLSAEDEIGEIWVRGDTVSSGYWNNPIATNATFMHTIADTSESGFLRTGDLGFLYNGELYISGRFKDLIIVHGRNYFPQDIEYSVSNSHDSLAKGGAAAFGMEGDSVEELIVVQEMKRHKMHSLDTKKILQCIKNTVTGHWEIKPSAIVLVQIKSIPKTSSGKLQRQKCKQLLIEGKLKVLDFWVSKACSMYSLFQP